jgi:GDP-L-fucose synthase
VFTLTKIKGGSRLKEDDWSVMDINLTMYYNLLQYKKYYKKLIHFGSGAETYILTEPYGYSKKVIAKSILNQDNFYNLKIFGVFDENELDTRFIKANIKRHINREPIVINQDKAMDFFYMQDLIKVVEYYINEKNPPKEIDCVYNTVLGLAHIARMINKIDEYEIDIITHKEHWGPSYISLYRDQLPIEFIGLEQGIIETYKNLKKLK